MPRQTLTDRALKALKPAPDGKPYDVMDAVVPGLGVRVLAGRKAREGEAKASPAQKTFILLTRFPGSTNPTRRALGAYGLLSLDDARQKARGWLELIRAGKDPAQEEERQRLEEARKRQFTVTAVAEAFFLEKLPRERKGDEVARDLRRDLLSRFGDRPISAITRLDIRNLIKEKKQTAPAQARNLLGYIKRLFRWAVDQEVYGLAASPCADIWPREIIGERAVGERSLSDDEIFALWRAAGREAYPVKDVYRLLLLNALRLNEVARASSPEFEFAKRDWTIPAARMKGKNGSARAHLVPLTGDSLAIFGSLPTFTKGPYLFSTTFGKSPVWIGSRVKERIDREMLRILKALARKRGKSRIEIKSVTLEHWTNHDIRRTVRTNLSALKNCYGQRIADDVKEAVIAHKKPGIKGVYDKYEFADEKFEALELWAERLREIVLPPDRVDRSQANVVQLRQLSK